jgi:hypothetical protein
MDLVLGQAVHADHRLRHHFHRFGNPFPDAVARQEVKFMARNFSPRIKGV